MPTALAVMSDTLPMDKTLVNLTVASVIELTPSIKQFELVPEAGATLAPVEAGAHIEVLTGNGLFRSYSLTNWGEQHRYVIAVQLEPGSTAGSQYMHDFVDVGEVLTVRLASNGFPLSGEPRPALLIAGGIGVTPILCMARALAAQGADFELHYCGRSPSEMAYQADIRREFAERAHFYESSAQRRLRLQELLSGPCEGRHLYVCGPRRLIEEARSLATDWPVDNVHYELFINASATAARIREPAIPFEIELARSGRVLSVSATETILDVLLRNGVKVPCACVAGICGTCVVPLLGGRADHRDAVLSEQERRNRIQTCCSRAQSGERLVLDR